MDAILTASHAAYMDAGNRFIAALDAYRRLVDLAKRKGAGSLSRKTATEIETRTDALRRDMAALQDLARAASAQPLALRVTDVHALITDSRRIEAAARALLAIVEPLLVVEPRGAN